MAPKRDTSKVMDVLAKMGAVKRVEDPDEPQMDAAGLEYMDEALENAGMYNDFYQDQEVPPDPDGFAMPEAAPAPASYGAPAYAPAPETPYGIPNADSGILDEVSPEMANTDQYLGLEQLYQSFAMPVSGVNTIYLIESYMKTLPDTLPAELRRSIILKIVDASEFNFDSLLNDGIDRVSRLNEYSSLFAARTEEVVERHNVEIDALERQVQQIRELINERKNLHKRQFLSIESEAQRLRDILDFITK